MSESSSIISIRNIAEACGVSLMTVSRAFRENSAIRPETRARILKQAELLGYVRTTRKGRPSVSGNAMRQIQLILGNSGGNMYYFHMRLLTALEQQLAEAGFECIIRTCNGNFDIFVRLLERVRNDHSMATIVLGFFRPEQLEQLLLAAPGALLLDNHVRPAFQGPYSSFSFDNRRAAYLAVSHLTSCKRRKILLIAGPEKHFFSEELIAGYRDALADAQLEFKQERIVRADFSARGAAQTLRKAFASGIEFDSIFTNDEMATGVYRVLNEYHCQIPDDISVCGCDNLPIGEQLYPELTTIALDYNELAACAVRHILSGKSSTLFPEIKLPPVLRVKNSTRFK